MEGFQREIEWVRLKVRRIPPEFRDSFMRETGSDNLMRLRLLSLVIVLFSVLVLLNPTVYHTGNLPGLVSPLVAGIILGGSAILILAASQVLMSGINSRPAWLLRLPVIVLAIGMLWWGSYVGNLKPFGIGPLPAFMICLFIICSVFILSVAEVSGVMLNGILSFYWFQLTLPDGAGITPGQSIGVVILLSLAFLVSRVIYYSHLSSFLNWENISSMNSTLKWEIKNHKQTLQELEAIRTDLDRQVREKTSYLRETNQKLQEEIAERGYADKVRTVLYRISGLVNQNINLHDTINSIHEQLRQILDVTNLMVGIYDSERLEIDPVYQENSTESFQKFRLGRTLSSYIIRHKRSLLVSKKGIREMVGAGDVEIVGVPADSWLGIPLMVDERVVGILVAQSYKSNVVYDQADLQILEYASEHLALAIERYQVQSKLITAKEQAEKSDRLKSAFLSNLSHEIRTPLNSILGFTDMINDPDFTDTQRQQYTSQVLDNGHRLLNTLTKMIELAKLQANEMHFDMQELKVNQVFKHLIEEIGTIASYQNKTDLDIRIVCDSTTDELSFKADPTRFKQLILCLAENAVKFTDQGYMEVGCRKFDQRQLLFWVKDTGIGMNGDELEHVFEWFTKGQAASENLYQGTGLGLTITKLIVELMNGQVWAESDPGQGSCFYFTLPAILPESIRMIPTSGKSADSDSEERSVNAV